MINKYKWKWIIKFLQYKLKIEYLLEKVIFLILLKNEIKIENQKWNKILWDYQQFLNLIDNQENKIQWWKQKLFFQILNFKKEWQIMITYWIVFDFQNQDQKI